MPPEDLSLPVPSTTAPAQAPVPIVPAAGGLLPIPGDISQTTSSQSSGFSKKVATPGLSRAMGQRRTADAEMNTASSAQTDAAEEAAKGILLEQKAKNLTREKDLALQGIAAKEASDAFNRAQAAQDAAAKRIQDQELQYKQMDNQSFWGESKTWQKVLWGVSLALGGYGSALSRSQNTPLLMLTKTIDDWGDRHEARMKALAADISAGRSKPGSVAQEYALKEQQLLPLRKAAAHEKVGDLAEKEFQALSAAGNSEAAGKAQKLVADSRAAAAKLRQEQAAKEEQAQQFLAPTATGEKRTGNIVQGPNATQKRMNEKQISEARKAIAAQQRIDKVYDKLQANLEKYGDWEVLDQAARKERTQLVNNLRAELKGPDFFNLGAAMTENEEALLDRASGGVDSMSIIDQLPRLLQGRDLVKNRQREKLQGLGVDAGDVDNALAMDPAKIGPPSEAGKAVGAATAGQPKAPPTRGPAQEIRLKNGKTVRGWRLPNGDVEPE